MIRGASWFSCCCIRYNQRCPSPPLHGHHCPISLLEVSSCCRLNQLCSLILAKLTSLHVYLFVIGAIRGASWFSCCCIRYNQRCPLPPSHGFFGHTAIRRACTISSFVNQPHVFPWLLGQFCCCTSSWDHVNATVDRRSFLGSCEMISGSLRFSVFE